jgi:hypothetical protein
VKRALALAVLGAAVVGQAAPAAAAQAPPVERVWILSVPGLGWDDVERASMPNLQSWLTGAGAAGLSAPGVGGEPSLADIYTTISAGARAESRTGDGDCTTGGSGGAIDCPGIGAIARHNDGLLYDAGVGALGDALAGAGVPRAVIAREPSAALALADSDGSVPHDDPRFGCRDRCVVLADAPGVHERDPAARRADLEQFDRFFGEWLAGVDPQRDAVLVVAPSPDRLRLTVAALRAPGLRPGLLRSAWTGRSGIVGAVDVAPTVLELLGIDAPEHMEGRPFELGRGGGTADARVRWLAGTAERSQFRDSAVEQAGAVLGTAAFFIGGMAVAAFARGRARRGSPGGTAFEVGALAMLFFLPATYLAMLIPAAHSGLPAYWVFVSGSSLGAAVLTYVATDRRTPDALIIALGAIAGLIVVDVVTGARLQLNGTFGYSPTIGGRYAGLGNLGYAQLASASLLLAGLLASRVRGRAGVRLGITVLAVALVADGAPYFGADVGGVLSLLPAFGVTAAMLLGWKFRWRLLAVLGLGALVLLALAAAVDLARPAGDRTHLGRVLAGDGGDLGTVLRRKIDSNLAMLTTTPVTFLLPIVYAIAGWVAYRAPGPLRVLRRTLPQLTASLAGLGIVAVLGTLLNDSGIKVAGMVFCVAVPAVVFLCVRLGTDAGAPAPEPEHAAAVPGES